MLEDGTYTAKVKEEVANSRNVLKVTGIPAVYLNNQQITIQDYTKEEMVRILQEGQAEAARGMCCGLDGCS